MLIMKRDLKKVFQDCKMIAVVQNNASNAEDMMILKHRLHKHGITVKFFPNQVMLKFYLQYCEILMLWGSTVLMVWCEKEPKVLIFGDPGMKLYL